MSNRIELQTSPRDRAFTGAFALLITALGCSIVLLSVPREAPLSLPVLMLPTAEVRDQLAHDRALAMGAPSLPASSMLYGLLLEVGHQELARQAVERAFLERLPTQMSRLNQQLEPAKIAAMRARASERFMLALAGQLSDLAEARGLLGEQPGLLATHGYLSSDGTLLAPELSVRATYKVRWNQLFGRPTSEGLSRVERCAYEGFRGLEAQQIPPAIRDRALREYASLGCAHGTEALAIWLAQNQEPALLIDLAREQRAPMRVRNMALTFLRPAPGDY